MKFLENNKDDCAILEIDMPDKDDQRRRTVTSKDEKSRDDLFPGTNSREIFLFSSYEENTANYR